MTGPNAFNDTADDHKRLEADLVAQDRDAARVTTADVDETSARHLVGDLLEDDVVIPVAEQRVLVHEPSGEAFDSITQLAVFHRGWTAARDADEEE
ncbi:hypothetical protein CP556_20965 [Natrinema sp. CBA1119]|uniref:hypothetical protein n=1 Tax=Natrinema sp. CBA1119 TaxID=1608465 RepID=UPI000BF34B7D|nr:hypothetical protein [Natrinema sp. CBA1119]PGF14571.1 hypothetical protein CP556_20965 [Natrinema sp. CBA1119]